MRKYLLIIIFFQISLFGFCQELKFTEVKDKAKIIAYNGPEDKALLIFQTELELSFEASNDPLSTISKNNGQYKVPITTGSQLVTVKSVCCGRKMLNFVYDDLGVIKPKEVRFFIIEKANIFGGIADITKEETEKGISDFPTYNEKDGFLFFYTTAIPNIELQFKEKNGYITKVIKDADRYQLYAKSGVPIVLTISAKGYDDLSYSIENLEVKEVKYFRLYSFVGNDKTISTNTSITDKNNSPSSSTDPLEIHRFDIQNIKVELAKFKNVSPYGTFKSDNYGNKYSGEYDLNNRRSGKGILINSNGSIFKGDFNNGSFYSGQVDEVDNYGNKYTGQYDNFKRNGKGTLIETNGSKYEGTFNNGSFYSGYADEIDNYGNKYIGQYNNFKREGKGLLIKTNGSKYDGIFNNGSFFSGQVDEIDNYGNKYTGHFDNFKRNGNGTLIETNGSKYEGTFNNGSFFSGQVDEIDNYGNKYTGQYNNFKRNGKGSLIKTNGSKYDGTFSNGSFWNGYADEIDNYGNKFVGQYINGRPVK